jgi:hypothetical protein
MTPPVADTETRPSAWAWALFAASSAFALGAAALLGFTPFG